MVHSLLGLRDQDAHLHSFMCCSLMQCVGRKILIRLLKCADWILQKYGLQYPKLYLVYISHYCPPCGASSVGRFFCHDEKSKLSINHQHAESTLAGWHTIGISIHITGKINLTCTRDKHFSNFFTKKKKKKKKKTTKNNKKTLYFCCCWYSWEVPWGSAYNEYYMSFVDNLT